MTGWRPPGTGALAWLAATALGIAGASLGLRPVLDVAVPDRAGALSAAEVRGLAVPSAVAVPAPTPTVSVTSPAPSPPKPTQPGSPGPSPAGSSSTTTVVDGWTVTTQADGSRSYLRSFQVRGGTTVIRMIPGKVSLVSATPNPEYSVEPVQSDPTRLVVQFITTGRYDIVDAMWWNDRPYAEVSPVG